MEFSINSPYFSEDSIMPQQPELSCHLLGVENKDNIFETYTKVFRISKQLVSG